ncbi:hypothetical protein [Nocardiopsis halotolerans]|uniref:hypothetical protein n=1 Tax=Nocardiopsis halotolerans TaxID=124252 RepID=UPI000346A791|nr:hypothetical protein [Nocardiopsis halotolerans]
MAALLAGACFQRGFLEAFHEGDGGVPPLEEFAADLVDATGAAGKADAPAPGGAGAAG